MPKVALEVEELHKSITRPVALDAVRHIMRITGISKKTPINFTGVAETVAQPGSTLEGSLDPATFDQSSKVFVEIVEDYIEADLLVEAVHREENWPFFEDRALGVSLKPSYSRMEMVISLRYRTKDRPSAEAWRNGIRRKIAETRAENVHEIQYHYPIPYPFMMLLTDVHKNREATAGYGEKLSEYLRQKFSPKVSVLATVAGTAPTFVVRERQVGVLGWFDFTSPPQQEKEEEGSVWSISCDYHLQYDKPISVVATYPLMVHNKLLPKLWIDHPRAYRIPELHKAASASRHAFNRIIANRPHTRYTQYCGGVQYPAYDDWLPTNQPPGTTSMVRVLLKVDPKDEHLVLDLHELPWPLDPELYEYILSESRYVFTYHECPIVISLYEGDVYFGDEVLEITPAGVLRSKIPLSLRDVYHLRLAIQSDLSLLSEAATKRICKKGTMARRILLALEPKIEQEGLLPALRSTGEISVRDWLAAIRWINTTNRRYKSPLEVVRITVTEFFTIAERKDQ